MKKLTIGELSRRYLGSSMSVKYPTRAGFLCPDVTLFLRAADGDQCYTSSSSPTNFTIELGSDFYSTIRKVSGKSPIEISDQLPIYTDIRHVYDATFMHELGHVLYTPMKKTLDINCLLQNQRGNNFASLFRLLSNIVEDVVIEGELSLYNPDFYSAFLHLRSIMFSTPPEIDEGLDGVMKMLLHNYRNVSDNNVLYPNKDIHDFVISYFYICINTSDPVVRIERTLAFAAALWDVFFLKKDPHYTHFKNGLRQDFYNNLPEEYKDAESNEKTNGKGSYTDLFESRVSQNEPMRSSPSFIPEEKEGKLSDEAKEVVDSTSNVMSNPFVDEEASASEIINGPIDSENVSSLSNHSYMKMSNFFDSSLFLTEYMAVVSKYSLLTSRISDIIKKRKIYSIERWETNKAKGKLDDKSFYKNTHKIFKVKNQPAPARDLVISILMDNSGSMGGKKSTICGEAAIVLGEVCHKLNIPFEINAFTTSYDPITLGVKEFNDNYVLARTNLALFTNNIHEKSLYMYGANVDEANLNFVWQRFRKRPESDKVLIVISDGCTCGSRTLLEDVVKTIEKDGVQVLGLGIMSDEVAKYYSQHKIFSSSEELEELPKFLQDYLVKNMFKGGMRL